MLDIEKLNLLNTQTICHHLSISRSTLERWVSNDKKGITDKPIFPQPCILIGGSPRWRASVINAWLNKTKAPVPLIDFQTLVPQVIQDAKRVHQVYGGIDDDLVVFICGSTTKACDQIRSMFAEGVGDVFAKAHIRFYFVPGDDFEAGNLTLIRGNTALRCLIQSGYHPSPIIQKSIHTCLVTSAAAVECKVERLFLEVPL